LAGTWRSTGRSSPPNVFGRSTLPPQPASASSASNFTAARYWRSEIFSTAQRLARPRTRRGTRDAALVGMKKLLLCLVVAACSHGTTATTSTSSPATEQASLDQRADTALADMRARDSGLDGLLQASAGYAVFPEVGQAGALIAGGAYGRGVLYDHGTPV